MPVEQAFLQWYAQLFPEDQAYLCNFLRSWLSQQVYATPELPVIQIFLQGYGQLSPNEQQILCNFLNGWLNPPSSLRRVDSLRFGGKFGGPVPASIKMVNSPQKVNCPHCKREFEIIINS